MNDLLKIFYDNKIFDDEEFKFLVYPGVNRYMYVISNYGRIFSFSKEKELKFHYDKDGYKRVGIIRNIDGKRYKSPIAIHRMVASTFCKKPDNSKNVVNHIDGKKTNNYYKNLEWCTSAENTRHAILTGLRGGIITIAYTEEYIREICKKFEEGMDCKEIYIYLTGDNKIENRALYALIFSIKQGKRHKNISSEYDIPNSIISKSRTRFSKEEESKIKYLILSGYSNLEIAKYFGAKNTKDKIGRRVCDKTRRIRKTIDERSTTRES